MLLHLFYSSYASVLSKVRLVRFRVFPNICSSLSLALFSNYFRHGWLASYIANVLYYYYVTDVRDGRTLKCVRLSTVILRFQFMVECSTVVWVYLLVN